MNKQGYRHLHRPWLLSILLAVAILTTILPKSFAQTPNTWIQKANVSSIVRYGAVSFSIGNKGYLGTGNVGATAFVDFWEYDPANNTWSQKADVGGVGRTAAVGFSIGSKGYIGTGNGYAATVNDFWEYDPAANAWTQKAPFAGGNRYHAAGFAIGGKGYIGAGENANITLSDFWEYTPATNTWVQKASFGGGPRASPTGFSIGGKGYMGTGIPILALPPVSDFWEYTPATNTWIQKASFGGGPRTRGVGFSIGGKGYMGGGSLSMADFWEFDPAVNVWTQRANFGGGPRAFSTGCSIGGKGYMGTGTDSFGSFNDFWEYTPSPTIQTDSIAVISYCGGDSIHIPFTVTGSFNAGNVFTAQLSDGIGSFTAPVSIGNITGTVSGTIHTILPVTAAAGFGYRIRIIGSNPATTGIDNGSNLAINTTLVIPSIVISTPLDTVCVPFPVSFTAIPVNGGNNPVYHWKRNGVNVGTNSTTFTYTPSNHDSITCTLTSSLTCAVPATVTSNAIILTVNPPNLNVVPANATFCEGDSIVLKAVDSTTIGLNYQWQINSNNISGATTFHYTAKTTGAYTLVFNVGNCTAGSAFIPVNVNSSPVPFIHLLSGGKMQTDNYISYQWYFNDTAIAGATSISYIATKNGAYKVKVVDGNGCTGTSLVVHFPWVGVASINALNESFSLYPNPASGAVSVTLPGGINDATVIRVFLFDITGKEMMVLYSGSVQGLRRGKTLMLPPVVPGLYMVRLEFDGMGAAIRKLSIW